MNELQTKSWEIDRDYNHTLVRIQCTVQHFLRKQPPLLSHTRSSGL